MKIKVCVRCGMHETSALINFDRFGICQGCVSSEQKMHINWQETTNQCGKIWTLIVHAMKPRILQHNRIITDHIRKSPDFTIMFPLFLSHLI